MKKSIDFLKQQKGKWLWAVAAVLLSALLPEYVFPFLLVIACVKLISFKKLSVSKLGIPSLFLLGFSAWQAVGLIYTGSVVSGLAGIGIWLGAFACFLMMNRAVDSVAKLDTVMFAGALSGGVAGGIGVAQMVLYHYGELIHPSLKTLFNPFWHPLDNFVADVAINHLLPDFAMKYIQRTEFIAIVTRASGTFTNPLMYALFLTMMLPLAVYCMFYFNGKVKKFTGFVCAGLIAGGIAASYSRGPYLAIAAVFVVMLFYGGKRALAIVGIGVAGIAGIAVFASGVFKRLLTLFSATDISINTRSQIWKACFEMLDGHWVFGYGTGVNNVREQLHETYGIEQPHAHNIFLEILLENGIFGLLIFVGSFIAFGITMIMLMRYGKKARGIAVTLVACLVAFCACGMTDHLLYGLKPVCYMMMLFGMGSAILNVYKQKSAKDEV